jgi:hypothetical protein
LFEKIDSHDKREIFSGAGRFSLSLVPQKTTSQQAPKTAPKINPITR